MRNDSGRTHSSYNRSRHGTHNLRRAEVIENPRIYWEAIAELPPVFYDEVGGVWVCSGYAESVEILANHGAFSSVRHHTPVDLTARGMENIAPTAEMLSSQFLFSDPPNHTRIRNALRDEFSPKSLRRHEAKLRDIANSALDKLPTAGSIDVVGFAEKLPEHLMAHLLGMAGREAEITDWADSYERLIGSLSTFPSKADLHTIPHIEKAMGGLRRLAADRLKLPGQDLISILALALRDESYHGSAEATSRELLDMVAANAMVLVAGGYQTLTHLVSTGLLLLADNPEQLKTLQSNPTLIDSAVAEIMRLDGSSQYVGRHAVKDFYIGESTRITAGDGVLVLIAAANLDGRKFSAPGDFNITRNEGRHLGFGSGPHYCLGAPFAESLASWAILGFVQRYGHFELSQTEYQPVKWGSHSNTRSRSQALICVGEKSNHSTRRRVAGAEIGPSQGLPERELTTVVQRHQILTEWNDAGFAGESGQVCWHLLFEKRARLSPQHPAVECQGISYSYREIDSLANGMAYRLRSLGVEPECVVMVRMERSVELIVAILAIAKAGGVFLLASRDSPAERIKAMQEETAARIMLIDGGSRSETDDLDLEIEAVTLTNVTPQPASPKTGVLPGNTAYVVFTSGTTGRPKAICINHESVSNLHNAQRDVFRLRPEDRVLQYLSLDFDGCISEIVLSLLCGATLVVERSSSLVPGPSLARLMRRRRITTAIMTPSVWSVVPSHSLPDLRIAAFAGERLRGQLVRRWSGKGRRLLNLYGPAEAAIWSTWHECLDEDDPPIGRPILGKRVYVLDSEQRLVPAGVTGELYIAGCGIGRYRGQPSLMETSFFLDIDSRRPGQLMYRTGDMCIWREDGTLSYVGRRDRQVKIRGQRVELDEVEKVLESAPGVAACHVHERDAKVVAIVVPEPPGWLDEQSLRRHLSKYLHGGMIPSSFTVVESLPLTANGKVDTLREDGDTAHASQASNQLPATATATAAAPRTSRMAVSAYEETAQITWELAKLFASCLRIPQYNVKLDTDFFSAGGDSLTIAEFMAAAEKRFEVEVDIQRFIATPTLAGLVQIVYEGR